MYLYGASGHGRVIKDIIEAQGGQVEAFGKAVNIMLQSDIKAMGEKGHEFFLKNYTIQNTFDAIMGHLGNKVFYGFVPEEHYFCSVLEIYNLGKLY